MELCISGFALCISLVVGYVSWINVIKNDKRANLAITWKEDGLTETKTLVNDEIIEIQIPQLRVFVNAGTIQKAYVFFAYPYMIEKSQYDKEWLNEYPFEKFEAGHIMLHDSINSWFPKRQKKVLLSMSSFEALHPKEDATFMFALFLGGTGTYQLIMLVYKNLSTKPTLEVLDRIDCLTYKEVNNEFYIEQFKKCEEYLLNNNIKIV